MDSILIIFGSIFLIVGIIGSIVPVIPGPPLSYLALILLQLSSYHPFTTRFLVLWGLIVIAITILDYVIPVYGTKFFGGTKKGVWGATIGMFLGIFFFPPIGIIIGPFLGALTGELIAGAESHKAFKSAFGSFLGFLTGTLMKLIVSIMIAYHFIASFFS